MHKEVRHVPYPSFSDSVRGNIIKFEDKRAAEKCLTVMNGRNFAGAKLAAEMWDGHTSYKIEESDLESRA